LFQVDFSFFEGAKLVSCLVLTDKKAGHSLLGSVGTIRSCSTRERRQTYNSYRCQESREV